jgi:hypothetical protein
MDETDAQFDQRLCRVIPQADTTFFPESYVWKPRGSGRTPSANALACVADGEVWHEFVPARAMALPVHFDPRVDPASQDAQSLSVPACSCRRTGFHVAGTCARPRIVTVPKV